MAHAALYLERGGRGLLTPAGRRGLRSVAARAVAALPRLVAPGGPMRELRLERVDRAPVAESSLAEGAARGRLPPELPRLPPRRRVPRPCLAARVPSTAEADSDDHLTAAEEDPLLGRFVARPPPRLVSPQRLGRRVVEVDR